MAETQKESIKFLLEVCKNLEGMWNGLIKIRYEYSPNIHTLYIGPTEIYRDSEIFVIYQKETNQEFHKNWPTEILKILYWSDKIKGDILYDNTSSDATVK